MKTGEERTVRTGDEASAGGCCCSDPYDALSAERRPKPMVKNNGLRQVTCPTCGLIYWTNRSTDFCIACTAG